MSIGLKGNADGSGAIQVGGTDAITVSTSLNTTFAGTVTSTGTVTAATGTLYPIVSSTAVTLTTQTSIDFTSIPSWVKRITVMLNEISTNGTTAPRIQLSTGGTFATTGYIYIVGLISTTNDTTRGTSSTTGFQLVTASQWTAATTLTGTMVLTLLGSNIWTASYTGTTNNVLIGAGQIPLSGTLDQVRLTAGGTDTFDAGSINILYE